MKTAIITGHTSGIGLALSQQLKSEGFFVIGIARSTSQSCDKQIEWDLSEPLDVECFNKSLSQLLPDNISEVLWINNAGRLGNITSLSRNVPSDTVKTINLNFTNCVLMAQLALQLFKDIRLQIINISSGAAINPYSGWTPYCTSKTAIDMLTKCLALENKHNLRTLAIYPGVVETAMQKQIRTSTSENFPNVDKFLILKAENKLFTPSEAASKIIQIINNPLFLSGSTVDCRKT